MKSLFLIALLLPLYALADWQVDGSLAVDGETYKISKRLKNKSEEILSLSPYKMKIFVEQGKISTHNFRYAVTELVAKQEKLVTKGEEEIQENGSKEIYAKGEPGQPNSIIIIKLTPIKETP